MEKEFDPPVTQETKLRMSFLERYEGFCIDVIKGSKILFFISFEMQSCYTRLAQNFK